MTDELKPRRTLSLKPGVVVTRPLGPKPLVSLRVGKKAPPPAPAPEPIFGWKCKPCGQGFDPPANAADDEVVRCPKCNARIGKVGDFKLDPIPAKVRARPVKA